MPIGQLLDKASAPAAKQELSLFNVPPTQIAIDKCYTRQFFPRNPLNSAGPIIFELNPGDALIDGTSVHLLCKFKII